VSHCRGGTYTAIAPIVSHSAEKMKSAKASKDGVDRKTLGCVENHRRQKCEATICNRPYRIQTRTIVAPEATMENINRPPFDKSSGDPIWEVQAPHHYMVRDAQRDSQIGPAQQKQKQRQKLVGILRQPASVRVPRGGTSFDLQR